MVPVGAGDADEWVPPILRLKKDIPYRLTKGFLVLVFDNWRMLHGRSSFVGKRRMCGAYSKCFSFQRDIKLDSYLLDSEQSTTTTSSPATVC